MTKVVQCYSLTSFRLVLCNLYKLQGLLLLVCWYRQDFFKFQRCTNPVSKMVEFTPGTMAKLAEMLRPPEPEVLQGDDLRLSEFEITSTRDKVPSMTQPPKTPKNIEEFEEQEAREANELGRVGAGIGGRKIPEYTMNYQQSVTAEDVFLQIGAKTPSSSSCENLILKIKMPGDKMENVDLAVDTINVTINSSQYHLTLPLPHGINPDLSKASWDTDEQTLILKLKLDREFDFINF